MDNNGNETRPWTQEMVVVHRALRREFRLLADHIGRTAEGDTAKAGRLAAHADLMIDLLHHHHTGEDELLWPLLRQRCPAACALVDRMLAQHNELVATVERLTPELAEWRNHPRPETTVPLAASFAALSGGLCTHTCDEEPNVLPVIEEHVTVSEWAELGERARAAVPGDRQMFVLGLLLEEATDEERERWLAQMPAEARTAFETIGRPMYEAEIAALR
jgi:hemerythrin-like domain-containing protein